MKIYQLNYYQVMFCLCKDSWGPHSDCLHIHRLFMSHAVFIKIWLLISGQFAINLAGIMCAITALTGHSHISIDSICHAY